MTPVDPTLYKYILKTTIFEYFDLELFYLYLYSIVIIYLLKVPV